MFSNSNSNSYRLSNRAMPATLVKSSLAIYYGTDVVSNEGINLLTLEELQKAVEERGMRSLDVSETHLRRSLQAWLNLHLRTPPIMPGLIIFSRMFGYTFKYDK